MNLPPARVPDNLRTHAHPKASNYTTLPAASRGNQLSSEHLHLAPHKRPTTRHERGKAVVEQELSSLVESIYTASAAVAHKATSCSFSNIFGLQIQGGWWVECFKPYTCHSTRKTQHEHNNMCLTCLNLTYGIYAVSCRSPPCKRMPSYRRAMQRAVRNGQRGQKYMNVPSPRAHTWSGT